MRRWFAALERLDGDQLAACYHPSASFCDPVFPDLRGERVGWRWRMLASGATDMHLDYDIRYGDERKAEVQWDARYRFAISGRPVRLQASSTFTFWDNRIVRQVDEFSFWRWSRASVGAAGLLLGWMPWVRTGAQRRARANLDAYIARARPHTEDKTHR